MYEPTVYVKDTFGRLNGRFGRFGPVPILQILLLDRLVALTSGSLDMVQIPILQILSFDRLGQ